MQNELPPAPQFGTITNENVQAILMQLFQWQCHAAQLAQQNDQLRAMLAERDAGTGEP